MPRSEIFLVTKIWPLSFSQDKVDKLIPQFLEDLQVDFLYFLSTSNPFLYTGIAADLNHRLWP